MRGVAGCRLDKISEKSRRLHKCHVCHGAGSTGPSGQPVYRMLRRSMVCPRFAELVAAIRHDRMAVFVAALVTGNGRSMGEGMAR